MGSMAALELARRGQRVIGFDRFHPPHPFGSSHGKSRIIREAYFEHPQYVPLVRRAYERWNALEQDSGETLLVPTGGLMIGPPDGTLVSGARQSAIVHQLPYEELPAPEVRRRFPVFQLEAHEVGLLEPRAGVLFPEAAIGAALRLARGAGAELHFGERAIEWLGGSSILVRTERGDYHADQVVVAAGAWMGTGIARASLALQVARQPLHWFSPVGDPAPTAPRRMPVFIWEWEPGGMFYGFPDFGDGVKVAIHHQGEPAHPDTVNRVVMAEEVERLREVMKARTPALNGELRDSSVCLYTNTPDEDFLVDRSPADPRVILASPCSGHGFKFAPAIGEILADLVQGRPPRFDLSPFRIDRAGLRG
ncbi:MAG: N-methyl-L-tryptophan oxidase [Gemmatimonadales bacterium]|nr:N-methyl-L-tryptophan oxidase [Gemmatimonadales bacterium]